MVVKKTALPGYCTILCGEKEGRGQGNPHEKGRIRRAKAVCALIGAFVGGSGGCRVSGLLRRATVSVAGLRHSTQPSLWGRWPSAARSDEVVPLAPSTARRARPLPLALRSPPFSSRTAAPHTAFPSGEGGRAQRGRMRPLPCVAGGRRIGRYDSVARTCRFPRELRQSL